MSRRTGCPVEGCIEVKDKEMGDGFCTDHCNEWRRSDEFREAVKDENVKFAAQMRITRMLTTALRPHKKKWLKRLMSEANT